MKKNKYLLFIISTVVSVLMALSISTYASSMKNEVTTDSKLPRAYDTVALFDGKHINMKYKKSRMNYTLNKKDYIYTDKLENQYIMNESGSIIGFVSTKKQTETSAINQIELSVNKRKQLCEDFLLNQLVNISDYQYFGEKFNKEQNYYELTYYKVLNGIKTSDFVFIDVTSTGDIVAFAAPNMNSFSEIIIPKFTLQDYKNNIVEMIVKKYPDMYKYNITDTILLKSTNNVDLVVYFEVDLMDGNQKYKQGDEISITIA